MPNVITIDGPASSGKDSVGFLFASKINYQFMDSGAVYRAFCLKILREGIDINNEDQCLKVLKDLKIDFKNSENGKPAIFIDSKDETINLHTQEINSIIATVAAYPRVRKCCNKIQKEIGNSKNTVISGRATGTEVFPESKLKFFLTASPEVRAQRRFKQLKEKYPDITYEQVLAQTQERDKKDSEREASPMQVPDGAILVDTSNKNIEQSVAVLMENYKKVF